MKITRTDNCADPPAVTFHDLTEVELLQMVNDNQHAATLFVAHQGHRWVVVLVADGGDKIELILDQSGMSPLVTYDIPSRPRRYKFDDEKLKDILARGVFKPREAFLSHCEDFPSGYLESDRDFLENNNDFAVELLEALIPVIP